MGHSPDEPGQAMAGTSTDVPPFVDYLVGALFAICGLALMVGGTVLTAVVDREMIVDVVAEETSRSVTTRSEMFTDAELVEIGSNLVTWVGWGLLITGALLVIGGIGFAYLRYRAYSRYAETPSERNDYWANAVRGAAVSGLLSFVPFSSAIGGAVAGYLEHSKSDRTISVGALSGLIVIAPVLLLVLFALGGVVAGMIAVEAAGIALTVIVLLFLAVTITTVTGVGVGAIGGYAGGKLAAD